MSLFPGYLFVRRHGSLGVSLFGNGLGLVWEWFGIRECHCLGMSWSFGSVIVPGLFLRPLPQSGEPLFWCGFFACIVPLPFRTENLRRQRRLRLTLNRITPHTLFFGCGFFACIVPLPFRTEKLRRQRRSRPTLIRKITPHTLFFGYGFFACIVPLPFRTEKLRRQRRSRLTLNKRITLFFGCGFFACIVPFPFWTENLRRQRW